MTDDATHVSSCDPARPEPPNLGQHNGFDIYPMPLFLTLPVTDVARSAGWYVEALGFATMIEMPPRGPAGALVHLRLGKYQDVLVVQGGEVSGGNTFVKLNVSDAAELADQARTVAMTGLGSVGETVQTPWNTVEVAVTDPDGYRFELTSRGRDEAMHRRTSAIFEKDRV